MAPQLKESYALFYPDEGRYSQLMSFMEAFRLCRSFPHAYLINIATGEVLN